MSFSAAARRGRLYAKSLLAPSPARRVRPSALGRRGFEQLEDRVVPATYTVTTESPSGPGSLYQAVENANRNRGADVITFAAGVRTITTGHLSLDNLFSGIAEVSIVGPGAGALTVNGPGFVIQNGVRANLSGMTLTGSTVGAITNRGELTATGLIVTGNTGVTGGGITNEGTLTLSQSVVSKNTTARGRNDLISPDGGGIYSAGTTTLTSVTLSENTAAGSGGGIYHKARGGSLTLTNVTVSNNTAGVTGGVEVGVNSVVTVLDSTIAFNKAFSGAGGLQTRGAERFQFASATVHNTILAANTSQVNDGGDVSGVFTETSGDLIQRNGESGITAANGNLVGVDAKLLPLARDNNTFTPVHLPAEDSPARNAGNTDRVPAGLTTAQNGRTRVLQGRVDIGAAETEYVPTMTRLTVGGLRFDSVNPLQGFTYDAARKTFRAGQPAGVFVGLATPDDQPLVPLFKLDSGNAVIDPTALTLTAPNGFLTKPNGDRALDFPAGGLGTVRIAELFGQGAALPGPVYFSGDGRQVRAVAVAEYAPGKFQGVFRGTQPFSAFGTDLSFDLNAVTGLSYRPVSGSFSPNSRFIPGDRGVPLETVGAGLALATTTDRYTFTGPAVLTPPGARIPVLLGGDGTTGLTVGRGGGQEVNPFNLVEANGLLGVVTGPFTVGGVEFTPVGRVEARIGAPIPRPGDGLVATLTGKVRATLAGRTYTVDLGADPFSGLVIGDGRMQSFSGPVAESFTLAGFTFQNKGLQLGYGLPYGFGPDTDRRFVVSGDATISVDGAETSAEVKRLVFTADGKGVQSPDFLAIIGQGLKNRSQGPFGLRVNGVRLDPGLGSAATYDPAGDRLVMKDDSNVARLFVATSAADGDLGSIEGYLGRAGTAGLVLKGGAVQAFEMVGQTLRLSEREAHRFEADRTSARVGLQPLSFPGKFVVSGTWNLVTRDDNVPGGYSKLIPVDFGNGQSVQISDGRASIPNALPLAGSVGAVAGVPFRAAGGTLDWLGRENGLRVRGRFDLLPGGSVLKIIADASNEGLFFGTSVNGRFVEFDAAGRVVDSYQSGSITVVPESLRLAAVGTALELRGFATTTIRGQTKRDNFGAGDVGAIRVGAGGLSNPYLRDVTASGLKFEVANLSESTFQGKTSYTGPTQILIGDQRVNLTLGGPTGGLVVGADGKAVSVGGSISGRFQVGGVTIEARGLTISYAPAQDRFALRGAAGLTFGQGTTLVSVDVSLGAGGGEGLVLQNGQVQSLDATVNAAFTVGRLSFAAKDLRLTYDRAASRFTMDGTASVAFTAASQTVTLEVKFGDGPSFPGLVVENGQLKNLAVRVTSNFKLLGLDFAIDQLGVSYDAAASEYRIAGTVKVSSEGGKVFQNLSVQLGDGGFNAPGVVIRDGTLQALDITVNASFKLGPLTIQPNNLRVQYNRSTSELQLTGGVKVELASGTTAEASLPGGGITINTATGAVRVNNVRLELTNLKLGPVEVRHAYVQYADNGSSISVAGGGEVSLLAGKIVIGGSFSVVNGKLSSISLKFEGSPGLPVFQGLVYITKLEGSVVNLDNPSQIEVTAAIRVTAGPSMTLFGKRVALVDIDGQVSVNAERLRVEGSVTLLGGLLGANASGGFEFRYAEPQYFQVWANVSMYFGIIQGDLNLKIDFQGNVDAAANLRLRTPDFLPSPLGGFTLGSASVALRVRPAEVAGNSYLSVRVDIGLVAASARFGFDGEIQYYIDFIRPIPDVSGTFRVNGDGKQAADGDGLIGQGVLTLADVESVRLSEPDDLPVPVAGPLPTVRIVSAGAAVGGTDEEVVYRAGGAAAGNTVSLFVDTDEQGYDGELLADGLSAADADLVFRVRDLAAYAPEPFDSRHPLYLYAVVDDGVHGPVRSAYSAPVLTHTDDPVLTVPPAQREHPGRPVVFAGATAITVTDPDTDPDARIEVTLSVAAGRLTLGGSAAGVTVEGDGTDRVILQGRADAITVALGGLRYDPMLATSFADGLTITAGRFPTQSGGAVRAEVPFVRAPFSLDLPGGASVVAGGGPAPVLAGLTLLDADSDFLDAAAVRVVGYQPGVDELAVDLTDLAGLVATYDPAAGVLHLSGADDAATYEAALRRVAFRTAGGDAKSLSVSVSDGRGNDESLTVPLAVRPPLLPPAVAVGGPAAELVGGAAAVVPGLTLTADRLLSGATVWFVGGYVPGEDVLAATFENDAGGNRIEGNFDAAAGVFTFTGSATAAEYQAAVRSLLYSNTAASPTAGLRTLAVTATDEFGTATVVTRLAVGVPASGEPTGVGVPAGDPVPLPLTATGVAVAPGLTVTSPSGSLIGATVRLIGGFVPGEDHLRAGFLPEGVTADYDAAGGVLTLTGLGSADDYSAALASVVLENHGGVRTAGTRVIAFAAADGLGTAGLGLASVSVAAAPEVEAGAHALRYTGTPAAIDPALEVMSHGGRTLTGASVRFSGAYHAVEDRLEFDAPAGIDGDFDPATGTLTLTGTAAVAAYETALRSVRLRSLRANPTAGLRQITFSVSDGAAVSFAPDGRTLVDVDTVPVPLTLAATAGPVAVPEAAGPVALLPALTLTDPDGGDPVVYGATVLIGTGYSAGEDVLDFTPAAGIIGVFDPVGGELALTGTAPLSVYQAVLRTVTYTNLSRAPSTAPRDITVEVDDGHGDGARTDLEVLPQSANDAPTRTAGGPAGVMAVADGGAVSLDLGGLAYAPPAGMTEVVYTVTTVPDEAVGVVLLADGTPAATGATVSLDQLRGASFRPVAGVAGAGTFRFTVAGRDPATGRLDPAALTETVALTATVPPVVVTPLSTAAGELAVGASAGGTLRLVAADGTVRRTVAPFGSGFTAGVRAATADVTGDGVADLLAGTGPGVSNRAVLLDGATGATLASFEPFESSFLGGLLAAVGDLTGDGVPELVFTADAGGGPRVVVFDGRTFTRLADFFGIDDPAFRGGARAAVGDLNGDGVGDLVVAAGAGGGPRVAVYDGRSIGGGRTPVKLVGDFFAYEETLRNGVWVAAGDIDGDGAAELVTGAGPGGGPRVTVWDGRSLLGAAPARLADFFAGDPAGRDGAAVAVKTLDDDGSAYLVVAADGQVKGYSGRRLTAGSPTPDLFTLADPSDLGGVFVG